MAFPADRFGPSASPLGLRVPARQDLSPAPAVPSVSRSAAGEAEPSGVGIEADRLVPPSGNLQIGGQQIWLGPALAGRQVTIWANEITVHVLLDGTRLKTLPSRLGVIELARLADDGAPGRATATASRDWHRGRGREDGKRRRTGRPGGQLNVGYQLAGQRVTLRMDGTQMAVFSHGGELVRTLPCPVPPAERHRLRGARRAASTAAPSAEPVIVQRRVSQRGSIMVATQRIHVGLIHARKTVTVIASDHSFQISLDSETISVVPRETTREIHRYKAHATQAPGTRPDSPPGTGAVARQPQQPPGR
jgi:hypothetical protein